MVLEILGRENVVDASVDRGFFEPQSPYAGEFLRSEVSAEGMISAGFDGNTGNRISATRPIYVVAIDNNSPHDHIGWDDTAGGSSRMSWRTCSAFTSVCGLDDPNTSLSQAHSDIVLSTIGGSIEQGQDPSFTTTTARRNRSGIAMEAELGSMRLVSNPLDDDAAANALELGTNDSLDTDADIINMSFGIVDGADSVCNYSYNPGLANATIDSVSALGVLLVGSIGNTGSLPSCSLTWPGLRPPVVAVGGILTTNSGGSPPPYNGQPRSANTSLGGVSMVQGGLPVLNSAIDLLAPNDRVYTYQHNNGYSGLTASGVSFAAANVSGLAALWIDQAVANGLVSPNSPRRTQAALFLGANLPVVQSFTHTGTDNNNGFGRVKLFAANDTAFGSGSPGIQISNVTVSGGSPDQFVTVSSTALASSVTQLDVVAFWNETGALLDVADIVLRVESTCGSFTTKSDLSFNLTKRISFDPSGWCPRIKVEGSYLPSSRSVTVAFVVSSGASPI